MAASPSPYPFLVDSLPKIAIVDSLPNETDEFWPLVNSLPNITDESWLLADSLPNITNEFCEDIRQFPPLPSVVLSLLISLIIVLANVQLITVIFCTRELRRQVLKNFALVPLTLFLCQRFNLYIICLAFTDLAVGLLLPLSTFREMITIHSNAICDLLNSTIIFFINASIYIFVGLNLDRLHAIIRPLKYKSETKGWTTTVSIFLAFLVALTCSVPFWVHHKMPKDGCFCQYPGFDDVSKH